MNKDLLLQTQSYDYELDDSFIATSPADPKESAKLLIYNRSEDKVTHTTFGEIEKYLPKDIAILFNDTKVIKARIFGLKSSGGKVELLFNKPLPNNKFLVFIRGKVKVGTELKFHDILDAKVMELLEDGSRIVEFSQNGEIIDFTKLVDIFDEIGHMPLPPYIKREDSEEDKTDYQTVFAKDAGAVAAPTASLHFSDEMFKRITDNFDHAFLTLHVGAGTFKPVESENITDHPMHSEQFIIGDKAKKIIDSKQNVLAIGTTVTRTIEYYARTGETNSEANLFLHPNNKPIRVNHLLTNFHLPKSTLIMLVASFVGLEKTLELYEEAKKNNYKFFSYGDAMLII